ncbi:MAG: hypothetical protein KIT14_02555 [bacterium]|nr:hypothetical protein [bacterium]
MPRALGVAALIVLTGVAPATGRLLAPRAGLPAEVPGISGVQFLSLDRTALADLRTRSTARIPDFPLADGRRATLVLTGVSPFPSGARLETMTAQGPRTLARPDVAYFTGTTVEDPSALVLVAAGRRRVNGFVAAGGDVHLFGPDQAGRHRVFALRNVDPTAFPRPRDFCTNDLRPGDVEAPPADRTAPVTAATPVTAETGALRLAEIAIETDNELRAKFASADATLEWLGTLLAAATAIYERDVSVRLAFNYVRLWEPEVTDPWSSTSTSGTLNEMFMHWNSPINGLLGFDRDAVHFVSGKSVQGGIAYLDVLCNTYWAYGVSQVYGSFDLASPNNIWDVEVFTHELGHNFGSPHTHCYSPPLDQCWGGESGCYTGPHVSSQGTIMSYCHLHPGGLANIDLEFGSAVSARIASRVAAAAACLPLVSTSTSTTTTTMADASTTSTTAVTSTTVATSTTLAPGTTTTTSPAPTTTSTLPPPTGPSDGDADGVPEASDACPDTPAGDLVDAVGCSVCPCGGPRDGGTWRGRGRYLRCVRAEVRRRAARGAAARDALRAAQKSTCGRYSVTRCCIGYDAGAATCRLTRFASCRTRAGRGEATEAGPGSCLPTPCAGG